MPLALVGRRDPWGKHRGPAEGRCSVCGVGGSQGTVPETGAGADDSGPDRTDDRLHAQTRAGDQRGGDRGAGDLARDTRPDRNRRP